MISVIRLWIPSPALCCPASWHFLRDVDSPLLWLCYYLCGLVRDGTELSPIPTLQLSYRWRGGILVQYSHLEKAVWKGLMTPVTTRHSRRGKGRKSGNCSRLKWHIESECVHILLCALRIYFVERKTKTILVMLSKIKKV